MLSMTGYGRGRASADGREITVEMKSVNHRFLDLAFHMPHSLAFAEETIREQLRSARRGHIEITVTYANHRPDSKKISLDGTLLKGLFDSIHENELLSSLSMPDAAQLISLSGALSIAEAEEDQQAVCSLVSRATAEALLSLEKARTAEGEHLKQDLLSNLSKLQECLNTIVQRAPQVPLIYKSRLESRLAEWNVETADPQRVAQEVAIMADHCAIDEETSRLAGHILQFQTIVRDETETGRKLDFLIQEMNREINTTASKASDSVIIDQTVQAKCIIEKLREQVQNAL